MRHDALSVRWYARPDDLIGGWCVMSVDRPPSRCDWWFGLGEVASFAGEAEARHMADLHNAWLEPIRADRLALMRASGWFDGGMGMGVGE